MVGTVDALRRHHLDCHVGVVEPARHRLHQAHHHVLHAGPVAVVVQHERAVGPARRAAEGGRAHTRVDGGKVVVQRVEVLQEVGQRAAEHAQDLLVARLLAEVEERLAEQLPQLLGVHPCAATRDTPQ